MTKDEALIFTIKTLVSAILDVRDEISEIKKTVAELKSASEGPFVASAVTLSPEDLEAFAAKWVK